eukprot:827180_1
MPLDVLQLSERFMRKAVRILVKKEEITLDGIRQWYVAVDKEDYNLATLFDLYESLTIIQSIIFVNTRRKAVWLSDKSVHNDFNVSVIHGEILPS